MRWRFLDANNPRDAAERKATIARIDAWWREFQSKTDLIGAVFSQKSDWDLAEWIIAQLALIQPGMFWEFGPAIHDKGHRLVITPESSRHLRPLTTTILERAPTIAGWEFYGHRLPEDVANTLLTVNGRTGRDISDFKVRVAIGEHHRINVCYISPHATDEDDQVALGAAFVATETLLGEECLDKWIGAIELSTTSSQEGQALRAASAAGDTSRALPLERLQETTIALIESLREQLPPRPHVDWIEQAKGTVWKLNPDAADDYPEQWDLFVGKSANPPLWVAAHCGAPFYSERFSRCGESFCYVKIDGSEGLDEQKFADKGEIEDALDAALKPRRLGCKIGGGSGNRYSYVDVALADLDQGTAAIRQCLQAGNVPRRSWIQFYDADLVAEWIGVYDDSPPPPMAPIAE